MTPARATGGAADLATEHEALAGRSDGAGSRFSTGTRPPGSDPWTRPARIVIGALALDLDWLDRTGAGSSSLTP
jgi:hypothetical protein